MSDLVLNVNLDESQKRNNLVIETLEGAIPHLKSRQYSGPLRNVNINGIESVDNITPKDLEAVREYLNSPSNIQIAKHQYLLGGANLRRLRFMSSIGCLFYKKRRSPMYQVDEVVYGETGDDGVTKLNGIRVRGDKTKLYIEMEDEIPNVVPVNVSACAYVELDDPDHALILIFEYGGSRITYGDGATANESPYGYRDYAYESRAVTCLRECHWNRHSLKYFTYTGSSFQDDLIALIDNGIRVFTETRKQIVKADYSNVHVSYGVDWFDIDGTMQVDGQEIEIAHLVDLASSGAKWVEIGESIVPTPESIRSLSFERGKVCEGQGGVRLSRAQLVQAAEIAYELNGSDVDGLSEFVNCDGVSLHINSRLSSLLRPYQKTGVRWLMSLHRNHLGGCLADDMGLGKTLQAIAYLSDSTFAGICNLIVVPRTLISNWEREFEKYLPELSTYVYHGASRSLSLAIKHEVIITTYGTLLGDIESFCKHAFGNIIVDEAQLIKNPKAKAHRAVEMISAETKILLTGTPMENNIEEYWGLMKLVNPLIFKNYNSVADLDIGADKLIEKVRSITAPFILRRMKEDALPDLPEKREQTIYCSMENGQRYLYDSMLDSIRHEIKETAGKYEIKESSTVLKGLLYLQEICCHPLLLAGALNPNHCSESVKLDLLLDMLEELCLTGHKVVVFSRFTQMLRIIENRLIAGHFNYYCLDGKTTHRGKVVEEFEHSDSGVFLISLKVGGMGINLVSADTVIIYDPWWNPATEKQAEDRVFRIGQTKNVSIYRLIVESSIEEKVQELQDKKKELFGQLLDGHERPTSLTLSEMRSLIIS